MLQQQKGGGAMASVTQKRSNCVCTGPTLLPLKLEQREFQIGAYNIIKEQKYGIIKKMEGTGGRESSTNQSIEF